MTFDNDRHNVFQAIESPNSLQIPNNLFNILVVAYKIIIVIITNR